MSGKGQCTHRAGPWAGAIDEALVALVAPMEPFQGQDRTGAIPQQPLEATAVAGLDPDRGIDREAPGVRALQHVLDDCGGQDVAALEQTQYAPARALLDLGNGARHVACPIPRLPILRLRDAASFSTRSTARRGSRCTCVDRPRRHHTVSPC